MPPLTRQRVVVRPELQMAAPSVEDEAWRRFTKGEEVAALRHRPSVSANSSIVPKNAQEHYPGESVGVEALKAFVERKNRDVSLACGGR